MSGGRQLQRIWPWASCCAMGSQASAARAAAIASVSGRLTTAGRSGPRGTASWAPSSMGAPRKVLRCQFHAEQHNVAFLQQESARRRLVLLSAIQVGWKIPTDFQRRPSPILRGEGKHLSRRRVPVTLAIEEIPGGSRGRSG